MILFHRLRADLELALMLGQKVMDRQSRRVHRQVAALDHLRHRRGGITQTHLGREKVRVIRPLRLRRVTGNLLAGSGVSAVSKRPTGRRDGSPPARAAAGRSGRDRRRLRRSACMSGALLMVRKASLPSSCRRVAAVILPNALADRLPERRHVGAIRRIERGEPLLLRLGRGQRQSSISLSDDTPTSAGPVSSFLRADAFGIADDFGDRARERVSGSHLARPPWSRSPPASWHRRDRGCPR